MRRYPFGPWMFVRVCVRACAHARQQLTVSVEHPLPTIVVTDGSGQHQSDNWARVHTCREVEMGSWYSVGDKVGRGTVLLVK